MNDLPEQQDASVVGGAAPGTFAFDPAGLTGNELTYAILSQPSEGWAINNHDGSFFFDPVMDFRSLGVGESRRVNFTYQASDGEGATQTATATLVVSGRSGASPMVELSGNIVVGAGPDPERRPAPPRQSGFITDAAEDAAVPQESLPEAAPDSVDDLGAIELVDIESPFEKAPESSLDQGPGAMAVEEQQRRVENSLADDVQEPAVAVAPEPQDHAAQTAVFDAPNTFVQDPADEPASQDFAVDSSAGSDPAFGTTDFRDDAMRPDFAADRNSDPTPAESAAGGLEMAPAPSPVFGESDDAATDWVADLALPETAPPPADLSAEETPLAPGMPESPDPIGVEDYQSDQFPLSASGQAAMESMAAPADDGSIPDPAPESRFDSSFGGTADTEPMTSFAAEAAPAATGAASPDDAAGFADSGLRSFAYADVAASGQVAYRILSQPIEGRVEDRGDGSFAFEPGPPLHDMAIGEMCQVDFVYQVEIDGQDTACMKATVTVIGTGDGPEADAVFFGPGEVTESLDSAPSEAGFTAAPVIMASGPGADETPLPVGPADLGAGPETAQAGFEDPAVPLPVGPADDRLDVAPAEFASVGGSELADEMPPGTEPWPTLDPAVEASLRKSHDDGPEVSSPLDPYSPVAELAAEHGTDVPDSIPAFLAGDPEAADSPALDDSPEADQSGFSPDPVGDEMAPAEQADAQEVQYLDDTPAIGLSSATADDNAASPAAFVPETEDILDMEGDSAPAERDPAMSPPAGAPDSFEAADAMEDETAAPPMDEETVAFIEDTAADFSISDQEPGSDEFAPLDAPEAASGVPSSAIDDPLDASSNGLGVSSAAESDSAFDLAAAYLKAQGADLSAPPPAEKTTFDQESGTANAGEAPHVFDDQSPFESPPEQTAPSADEIPLEGQDSADLLPGVTAADVLRSVVGGKEGEAGDAGDEIDDGERSDTLHVDGVSGGPGVGGWDLELTEGDIVETHSEYLLLSDGAAGAVVLAGNVGRIKFEGIERIAW